LGVDEIQFKTVSFYPNPTSNMVFWEEPLSIDLFSIDGRLIFAKNDCTSLNLTKLKSGIYILKPRSNEYRASKIILKH